MSVSRRQLDAIRTQVRQNRVRYVEAAGAWHRVVAGSAAVGSTYLVTCTGARAWGRTAVDLPEMDVCPDCRRAESEQQP